MQLYQGFRRSPKHIEREERGYEKGWVDRNEQERALAIQGLYL